MMNLSDEEEEALHCARSQTLPDIKRLNGSHASAWSEESQDVETKVGRAWMDMLDLEQDTLVERVHHLEKKVELQQDEISCLKATLAECIRRIGSIETSREQVDLSPAPDSAVSRIPQRTLTQVIVRREGVSSRPTGLNRNLEPGREGVSSRPTGSNRNLEPGTNFNTPKLHQRKGNSTGCRATGSLGRLHKQWRSSNDFDAPLSVYKRPGTGSSLSFRSPSSTPCSSTTPHSTTPYSSQHNLNRLGVPPSGPVCSEDGSISISIKGRQAVIPRPSSIPISYIPEGINPPPSKHLRLEWVYGYRGRDARCNLSILPTGEIIYYVAAVVVLNNLQEQSQRHYLGHTEEIKCIAIHPNRMIVASGQGPGVYKREGDPHIQVWNAVSLQTLHILGRGDYRRAVTALSFSKTDGGIWLVGVEESVENNITVWDWSREHKQINTKCSSETTVCAEFHPLEEGVIITCGKGHVNYWQIDSTLTSLSRRSGVLDPRDKPKFFTCLQFSSSGDLLTGDSNGNIFVWGNSGTVVTQVIWGAHDGPVFSLCVLRDGTILSGGGRDGRIVKYDAELKSPVGVEAVVPEHLGAVRVISQGVGSQVLVGTTKNCILAGTLDLGFREAVLGHSDEVACLAGRQGTGQFITASHDRMLYIWDSMSFSPVWTSNVGEQIQSGAFSPDGEIIVVATITAKWIIIDARTREVRSITQEGCDPLLAVKFSPCGHMLALLARTALFLYQVKDGYNRFERRGRFACAQSAAFTSMSWSIDSQYIQVTNSDLEISIWKLFSDHDKNKKAQNKIKTESLKSPRKKSNQTNHSSEDTYQEAEKNASSRTSLNLVTPRGTSPHDSIEDRSVSDSLADRYLNDSLGDRDSKDLEGDSLADRSSRDSLDERSFKETQIEEVTAYALENVMKIRDLNGIRDVKWDSGDCLLTWSSIGVWQVLDNGCENTVGSVSYDGSLLAVGEEGGRIRVYRYPADKPVCKYIQAQAHSGPITGLRFLPGTSRLISTGGRDTAVLQWIIET